MVAHPRSATGGHLEILLSVSMLTFLLPSACDSALACHILCKSDDRRRSYDVLLILQDGGHSVANLLPVSGSTWAQDREK